jgi:hypothetical protein
MELEIMFEQAKETPYTLSLQQFCHATLTQTPKPRLKKSNTTPIIHQKKNILYHLTPP